MMPVIHLFFPILLPFCQVGFTIRQYVKCSRSFVSLINYKDAANSVLGHNQNMEDFEFASFGFNVRLPEVNDIFNDWIQGLWFPPSDLTQTLTLGAIESM